MAYTIGDKREYGYRYTIEVNGLVTEGWHSGTYAQVEHYVKKIHKKHMDRVEDKLTNYGRIYKNGI